MPKPAPPEETEEQMTARTGLTASERSQRARAAVHASWANTEDPSRRTSHGTAAFLNRFEQQVDPDGRLSPAERARRAEHARKSYMQNLALKSVKARRLKAAARQARGGT